LKCENPPEKLSHRMDDAVTESDRGWKLVLLQRWLADNVCTREMKSLGDGHWGKSRQKQRSQYFLLGLNCWGLPICLKARTAIRTTSWMRYWKALIQNAIDALDTGS
jgi:hypothetical protein